VFADDPYGVQLVVMPAAMPVWLGYGQSVHGGVLELAAELAISFVSGRLALWTDPRWKVVTFRHNRRWPPRPCVIGIEFLATEGAAEDRRCEILESWESGRAAMAPAIRTRARGRSRRAN
jgi:hypothetical protein